MSACLNVTYSVENDQTPLPEEAHHRLVPGESDLAQVLEELGAPHIVLDSINGQNELVVLAYVWSETDDLGLQVSFNNLINQFARGAQVRFDDRDAAFEGVVVICDRNLVVESIRRGPLVDLIAGGDQESVTSIVRTFLF